MGGVDPQQPGLFNVPDPARPTRPERLPCGRNRETWARTVSADVTIVDAVVLQEAVREAEARAITLAVADDPEDAEPGESEPVPTRPALDLLTWLIWPTHGLEELLEIGAFRLLDMTIEVAAESENRGTVTWTVTIKLTDVDQFRRLAIQNQPGDSESITNSLGVAWQHGADPYAPLDSIPGITWRPGQVKVQHLGARATRTL